MGYWVLRDNVGEWAVDWDVVYRIIRAWHTSALRLSNYTLETTDVWSLGPTLRHYSFDWDTIRRRAIAKSDEDFARLAERATINMREVQEELRWMVRETQSLTRDFSNMMRALQVENRLNAEKLASRAESTVEALRLVRDGSAEFILIGATVVSGGAAAAALGGGAVMKGAFKYQDTRSVAGAVMATTGTIMFGAIKMAGGDAMKEGLTRATMIIMQSTWETGAALAEGKSVGDALASGAGKLVGGAVGDGLSSGIFKIPLVDALLRRSGAFVTVGMREFKYHIRGTESVKLLAGSLKKGAEKVVKEGTKQFVKDPDAFVFDTYMGVNNALNSAWTSATNVSAFLGFGEGAPPVDEKPASPSPDDSLLSSATLTDDLLLRLAIIDMKTGVIWQTEPGSRP